MKRNYWKVSYYFSGGISSIILLIFLWILSSTFISGGCFPSEYPLGEFNTPNCLSVKENVCTGSIQLINNCNQTYKIAENDFEEDSLKQCVDRYSDKSDYQDGYIFFYQGFRGTIPGPKVNPVSAPPWILKISNESENYFISGKVDQTLINQHKIEESTIRNTPFLIIFLLIFVVITHISRKRISSQ